MAFNLFTKTNEKTKSGAGTTLSTPNTVSLNNNVNLFNIGKTNTNKTSSVLNNVSSNKGIVTDKLSYDILKKMQNGTIDKNNLMSSVETARKDYIEEPLARQRATVDYLQSEEFANTKRTANWTGDESVDYYMHPQNMTPEGWIDRKLALDKGDTAKAKQIEEQDKAKRQQNWNDWWNSEAEVKKRQKRLDEYNKEQEKKKKEYEERKPESQKYVQEFINTTNENGKDYVRGLLSEGIGVNELADKVKSYEYVQGFIDNTQDGWWADYSQYDGVKDNIRYMLSTGEYSVDDLAKYIKNTTGYELPAKNWGERLTRGAKSLGKNTAKGVTKVGDSVVTGWSMAYTAGKNAITGSNDKYRQYNSWDDLNAELNGEIYRKEYKDPSLQNAWSNALSGGAGLAQVAQTVYFPVINYVFDTAGETQQGRDLFSNKLAGTAIGTVIGAVASRGKTFWGKVGTTGAGTFIGSVPTLVDKAVEEYAGDMSEEDKENLKGLITDGFFTALGVKETGNNYKPIQSKVQTVKNTAEAIKNVPKTVEAIKDSRAVKQATKGTEQATVSKEYDPTRVANANKNIDTRKIKTYEQWGNALKDRVKTASREIDSMLSKDKVYDLKDFNQKTTSGKTEVNYVKNALEDMKKFYEKNRSYEKLEKIEDILSGKEKLSELDVNNLAREYGIEFDAWLKNGELSSSANKQGYETTRMGIKQWLRENTEGGKKTETLDREISDIKNLEKIVDRRTKNVTSEEIRGKESVLKKASNVVFNPITLGIVGNSILPGYGVLPGVLKGIVDIAVSKATKKQGKSDLEIQKSLNKNLKKIQKLSERLKKKEITEKQVEREIEDLLSSEKQRSKFLKKKTKTEAKKLSEPKVKGLLTEGKKALPEGKKLLKSGEKTENKAKTEVKLLKKSKKRVEKKTEEKSNYTEVQNKIDEISKEIKNDLNKKQETEYNELYKRFDELRNKKNKTEAEGKELVNLQTKLNNLSNKYTKLHEEELKVKAKDLIDLRDELGNKRIKAIRESIFKQEYDEQIQRFNEAVKKANDDLLRTTKKELEKIIEETKGFNAYNDRVGKTERANRIAQGQYEELKKEFDRRGLDFTDEFSNLLKKPKKLKAKKLEKPKKESEVSELYKKFEDNKLKTKEEYVDLYVENAIKKGDIEFSDAKMIDAFKKQLLKTSTKAYLENSLKKDFGKDYKTDAGTKVPKGEGKATDRIKEHYKSKFKFVDKVPKGYEKIYTEGIRKIDGFDAYGKLEPVRGNPDLKTIDYSSIVYKEAEVKPLKKKGKVLNERIRKNEVTIKADDYIKEQQLEVIKKTNPMVDDYHTGIRSVKDIKTWEEALKDDESFVWGDFSKEDGLKALKSGKITVYSSKPIENGNFVSTSRNMARDYAGNGKIYEKEVKIDDVAWINGDEGQVAKISNPKVLNESNKKSIK